MTARQIRIACCGMVVSTRPFRDDADIDELADDIKETARILRSYGPVHVWVNEGRVAHLIRSWA